MKTKTIKSINRIPFFMRIEPSLREDLRRLAVKRSTSVGQILRQAAPEMLKREKGKK